MQNVNLKNKIELNCSRQVPTTNNQFCKVLLYQQLINGETIIPLIVPNLHIIFNCR